MIGPQRGLERVNVKVRKHYHIGQSAAEPLEKDWGRLNDYRKYNLEEKSR